MTTHLFPELAGKLLELLRGLTAEEWSRTAVKTWTVKDVSAHLLDTSLRRLSMGRDGTFGESFHGSSTEELKAFLNELNQTWVRASKRLSVRVLCDQIERAETEVYEFFRTLDPRGPALFGVSWAGEESSENWFDIAREYTERWHHQQQIRDAVGKPGIATAVLYGPVLETFVRALPVAYASMEAPAGTQVRFEVTGTVSDSWIVERADSGWKLRKSADEEPRCSVSIDAEKAWKLFTNGLSREDAVRELRVSGDAELARPCYAARAIAT